MKAFTLNGYEGLASLRFAEVAMPEPGPNDLLV
jgi:NADPH:quinone reductase-like Zn-dependent oxidoreductase